VMAAIPKAQAMMVNFTLMLLQRMRMTARPFFVMQMHINQSNAIAAQRRIKFTLLI